MIFVILSVFTSCTYIFINKAKIDLKPDYIRPFISSHWTWYIVLISNYSTLHIITIQYTISHLFEGEDVQKPIVLVIHLQSNRFYLEKYSTKVRGCDSISKMLTYGKEKGQFPALSNH